MKGYKALVGAVAVYGVATFINFIVNKDNALNRALSLSGPKGIINLGSGCEQNGLSLAWSQRVCELPQVKVNIDLKGDCAKCSTTDLEKPLPFADKQFDVAFASHILEHLENWEQALNEWTRIADHVVIVLPNPLSISGWMYSEHKQHFGWDDMNYIRSHWKTVAIFS